jgi:Tfp pilus assembly protein PilF
VFLEYARLLLWPVKLAPDYDYTHSVGISHALAVRPLIGLVVMTAAVAATLRAVWQRRPTQALGWSFLAVYLLPVSHLVPFGALLAERFLLVPSVGLVLLLIPLLWRVQAGEGGTARIASAATVVLVLVLGARSFVRARDWHDDVSLWTPIEARIKNDARIYNNLALGYMQQGDAERSLWATRRSLALLPDNRIALSNLGEVLMATGKLDEARASYERAVQLWPDYPIAHYNLAVLELRTGHVARARVQLSAALRANPNYAAARALSQQADALYARAQAFLSAARATGGNGSQSFPVAQVAAACRAVGDEACERDMRARIAAPPQMAPPRDSR